MDALGISSLSTRSFGISLHVRPSNNRPAAFLRVPPHCLKKKGTPSSMQASRTGFGTQGIGHLHLKELLHSLADDLPKEVLVLGQKGFQVGAGCSTLLWVMVCSLS